ncbi:MAG TPA: NADH-quinone oxidoreductase subunit NuoG [Xanthomonadales bacterium]|nr:NADH-quinone oxidoreductase subunit NuoG [Xanthomonadales bacterium]
MSAEMSKPAVDMVNIEVDGVAMQAPKGSMIIEATDKAGIQIPRFCYHKKLTIAANCRMCLVDVEKAPKPMPACATPVMEGMKVYTDSRRAVDAQHGVMEFLLINHPLDCPICDQGGECELQDLAMGYGRSVSRFTERKRVVKDKNVGSLVQTDMTRCIHCTRCVRFLEEIAGTSEMGGAGRGDRLEIGTCVQNSIDSELSGNIIDLCPVGALTNKPFRFAARAWELVARPSVAAHDGVGSLVYHHARNGKLLRAVPKDNEKTNETWLSDRDRYSVHGLYSEDRLTQPQIRKDGQWIEVSWEQALDNAAEIFAAAQQDGGQLSALISPSAATEEHYLAQQLLRSLGSNRIEHRLREQDFSDDAQRAVAPQFQMKIAELEKAQSVLMLGCNVRHEAPILGHRLRKAWQRGAAIAVINPLHWEFVFGVRHSLIVAPQQMLAELMGVALATAQLSGKELPAGFAEFARNTDVTDQHKAIAEQLLNAERSVLMLGQFAMAHHQAGALRQLAAWVARASNSSLNLLPHGANAQGAWLAGAVPHRGPGGQASNSSAADADFLSEEGQSWLLWDVEPEYDCNNPARIMQSLRAARGVVAACAFVTDSLRAVADVLLPYAPVAESEGSMINLDGDRYQFTAAGRASGEARPGWKILRQLGGQMHLEGFAQVSLADLQAEMNTRMQAREQAAAAEFKPDSHPVANSGLFRVGEVPMFSVDALCRRSLALQQTSHADSQFVGLNSADAERLGLMDGGRARVRQGENFVETEVRVSDKVPAGAAWIRSATCLARELGTAVGPISVEVA